MTERDEQTSIFFHDEAATTFEESLAYRRLSLGMRRAPTIDWKVAERFSDRFDTVVGDRIGSHIATQSWGQDGSIVGGMSISPMPPFVTKTIPPHIVDYDNGGRTISLDSAAAQPGLAAVRERLRERISEYDSHMRSAS